MKVLIIEDNESKISKLREFLDDRFPETSIAIAKSYQSGVKALQQGPYDLVLLDMTMPTFDLVEDNKGGRLRAFAGRDVLSKMKRRNMSYPVVVFTRFDVFGHESHTKTLEVLDKELHSEFQGIYKGYVFYDPTSTLWADALYKKTTKILKSSGARQ